METETEPRFLLHHSNTTYEGIYTLKAPCMRCLTVLENGLFSRSLTTNMWVVQRLEQRALVS